MHQGQSYVANSYISTGEARVFAYLKRLIQVDYATLFAFNSSLPDL